jgi:hypothetical protein
VQLLPCGFRQWPAEQVRPLWHWPLLAQAAPRPCEPPATHCPVAGTQLKPPAGLHWLFVVQLVGQAVLLPEQTNVLLVVQTVPAATGVQVPLAQLPQPWVQAVLQQTPPTQKPLWHWLLLLQPVPLACAAQTPFWQSPLGQAWPQAPQLEGSVSGLTQRPLQAVKALAQVAAHSPPEQRGALAGHTCPQAPQLCGSLLRLVQLPLQVTWSPLQPVGGAVQPPKRQTWPAGQAWPQAPQLAALLARSVQCPEQSTCSPGQPLAPTQTPWLQT